MGNELVGFGTIVFGIPMSEDAFVYATLDKAADAINLDIHRLIEDASEHNNHAAFR
jgi:hypothetical protein